MAVLITLSGILLNTLIITLLIIRDLKREINELTIIK